MILIANITVIKMVACFVVDDKMFDSQWGEWIAKDEYFLREVCADEK